MSDDIVKMEDWMLKVKNRMLLKAVINLNSVRCMCSHLVACEAKGTPHMGVGPYELLLLTDAIGALHNVNGGWDKWPFPSYSANETRDMKPQPSLLLGYATMVLEYIEKNLATMDR